MPSRKQPKSSRPRSKRAPSDVVRASMPIAFPQPHTGPEVKFNSYGANDQQLYHNVPATMMNAASILDAITAGSAPYQRVGNLITLRKIVVSAILNAKADRPNVSYRIVVTATPSPTGSADAFSEIFGVNATTTNMVAQPFPGIARVYTDRFIPGGQYSVTPLTSGGTTKERSQYFHAEVKLNAQVRYNLDNTAATRLTVWVVAYDSYGTLTTDNIASIPTAGVGLYFTDD